MTQAGRRAAQGGYTGARSGTEQGSPEDSYVQHIGNCPVCRGTHGRCRRGETLWHAYREWRSRAPPAALPRRPAS
jgi:hypothetical protein